jgi:hypothetical protein
MNPWDNPVAAPSYAAPLVNFGVMNPQQQQGQRSTYSFANPNPNGLAAKLAAYLNPQQQPMNIAPQVMNMGNAGGTNPMQNGGIY